MIKNYFRRHPIRTKRALEILPGFFSWFFILFPVWGSFFIPQAVAYYVIIFAVYWLYRSLMLTFFATISHFKIRAFSKYDYLPELKKNFADEYKKIHHIIVIPTYQEPISTLERT